MKNIIFIISVLMIAGAILIVYFNRDNATIYNRFVGVIFLGSLGLLISVLFTLEEESYEDRFVTSVILNRETKIAREPKNAKVSEFYGQETYELNTTQLNYDENGKQNEIQVNYDVHDLIVKRIIDLYRSRFNFNWEINPHEYFGSRGKSISAKLVESKQTVIKSNEIAKYFPNNPFFKITDENILADPNLNFPPKTTIKHENHCVKFINKFVQVSICYSGKSGGSISGPGKKLEFYDNDKGKVEIVDVKMNTTINSNKLISGNSEFKKNMDWAKEWVKAVKQDFDSNDAWKELSK